MSFLRQTAPYFFLIFSLVALSACQPISEASASTPIIIVGPDNQSQNSNHYIDIASAASSASSGSNIQIREGVYTIDNPITLHTKDIKIQGAGADKTIILAKNPNLPMFKFEADGITIEAVTINALIDDGPARASFAIQIQEGYGHCKISHTNILNSAASAIIGHSASDCSLISNVILNSGDDAVRMRGDRLTVIDNTIIRYFDEALDLAYGSDIVVTGNYASNGRIGIVVDDCTNVLVSHNYVENQILQGIVTGTDPEATITANIVRNSGNFAYNLISPQAVNYNLSDGSHLIGFRITDMTRGIVFNNTDRGSEDGFVFKNTRSKTAVPDENNEHSKDITFYSNCEQASLESDDNTCTQRYKMTPRTRNTEAHKTASGQTIYKFSPTVEIEGKTQIDKKRAKKVATLLKYYNPGILSIHIDDSLMKSKISKDLYETIKVTGKLGIGLVRAPFLQFSRGGERSFLWYLSVDGKDVIVVSSMHGGSKVRTSLLNSNGELPFLDSVELIKDKVLLKLLK